MAGPGEGEGEGPLLVVEARMNGRVALGYLLAIAATLALIGWFGWVVTFRHEAFVQAFDGSSASLPRWVQITVGVSILAFAALCAPFAAGHWVDTRQGTIRFGPKAIVLEKSFSRKRVAWTALEGYDDSSGHFVQLWPVASKRENGRLWWITHAPVYAIPTRTPEDRAAVLALLAERGVRRREG